MSLRSFGAVLSSASTAAALSLNGCTVLVGDGGYTFSPSGAGPGATAGDAAATAAGAGRDPADAGAVLDAAPAEVAGAFGMSHAGSDPGPSAASDSAGEGGTEASASGQTGAGGRGGVGEQGVAGATGIGGVGTPFGGTVGVGGAAGASSAGAAGSAVCKNCLQVYYQNTGSPESTTEIEIHFGLRNAGTEVIDLSRVTVRYYFNADGCSLSGWRARCDSSLLSLGQTACPMAGFASLAKAQPTADTDMELTLTGAGMLSPSAGASYEYIGAFNRSAYDCTFHQANDYSYRPNTPDFALTRLMTAYVQGQLVWGLEP